MLIDTSIKRLNKEAFECHPSSADLAISNSSFIIRRADRIMFCKLNMSVFTQQLRLLRVTRRHFIFKAFSRPITAQCHFIPWETLLWINCCDFLNAYLLSILFLKSNQLFRFISFPEFFIQPSQAARPIIREWISGSHVRDKFTLKSYERTETLKHANKKKDYLDLCFKTISF